MEVDWDLSTYRRILKLADKPSSDEVLQVGGIAGAGIVIVGFCGFILFSLMNLLPM